MQIRCQNCHRPFALGKEAVHAALDYLTEEDLVHYTVQCPHCRRANRLSQKDLLRAAPDWTAPEAGQVLAEEAEEETAQGGEEEAETD